MKSRLTGLEVLDIFGWIDHELIEAVKGGLVPLNPVDNTRLLEKDFPCLYCDGGTKIDPWSEEGRGLSDLTIRICSKRTGLMGGPLRCKDDWDRWVLARRVRGMTFVTAEVQEYALLHGLPAIGQDFTPQNAPAVTPGQDQQAEIETCPAVVSLRTPPGVPWDQIQIRIAKNDRFEILRPGYKIEAYNTKELGIAKARCKLAILKGFAHGKGKLKRGMDVATPQNISNLRKTIKSIFPDVEGEPIIAEDANYKRNYVCLLKIVVDKEEYSEELYKSDDVKNDGEDYEDLMDIHKPFYIKPREE